MDSSALIAALGEEPEAAAIRRLLGAYGGKMSAATLVEARLVAFRKGGQERLRQLNHFVRYAGIDIVTVDGEQADAASDAYVVYGKGTGHPARLNYGDIFSYALAYVRDEPLLYVGDDFSRTDLRSALEEYAE